MRRHAIRAVLGALALAAGSLAFAQDATQSADPAASSPAASSPAPDVPLPLAPAAASDAAPSTAPPGAAGMSWNLRIEAPDELKALLDKYLDIARFGRTPPGTSIGRSELSRLVVAAPAQARSLLQTEGYFSADVNARVDAAEPGKPVSVVVQVTPGPRTMVTSAQIEFEGPLSVALDAGDPDAVALAKRIREQWKLREGMGFTQSDWSAAKTSALSSARADGYPTATISGSSAGIDAATAKASLYVVIDSGPLFHFGPISFEGLRNVEQRDIEYLLPFAPGTVYREQLLLDYQDRLVKTGLFETVSVTTDTDNTQGDVLPVTVRVGEQYTQTATAGVGISDVTGPRLTLEHVHQRIFGLAWQAKSKFELGRDQKSVTLDFTSHPKPGMYRNLVGVAAERTVAGGLVVNSQRLRVGRTQDNDRIERLYYAEYQRATSQPEVPGAYPPDDASAFTGNYQWVWRNLDDPILPTKGVSISIESGGGVSFNTTEKSGPFVRGKGRITAYLPIGASWYATMRGEAGEVYSSNNVGVPFTLLFRAGGDESVRGYAYQSLGPDDQGRAVGGRVLATGSVELARPFSTKLPAWWGAVFFDVGDAARNWGELAPARGYGVGVRWRSPVGPLRIDVAYGEKVRHWRLHFSVGVVF